MIPVEVSNLRIDWRDGQLENVILWDSGHELLQFDAVFLVVDSLPHGPECLADSDALNDMLGDVANLDGNLIGH